MKKLFIILMLLLPTSVLSVEKTTNFTFEKFNNAQKNGKAIVVHSWNKNCGTCAKQLKIFAKATNDFEDVEFLFYEQTKYADIAKALNIKYWTTIVVFKGNQEIARAIGLSNKDAIYKIIKKAI